MAYCVNCGVELARGEPKCPLCGVVSINPLEQENQEVQESFPMRVEQIEHVDLRGVGVMLAMILCIPVLVSILSDLAVNRSLGWSIYVAGAAGLGAIVFVLPMILAKPMPILCVSIDCAAIALFLLLIERLTGGTWFLLLALPVTAVASAVIVGLTVFFTLRKDCPILTGIGLVLICAGIICMAIEVIVTNFLGGELIWWSLYAIVPCLIISAIAFFIESRKPLKEQLVKRLFF